MSKPVTKREFVPEWFEWVLKQKQVKQCDLAKRIGRSTRTIRRALSDGTITPDLLDLVARELNVHPGYLAGKYFWTLDVPYGMDAKKHFLQTYMNPDNYPYIESKQELLGVNRYLKTVLLMHGVSWDAYKKLGRSERQRLLEELDRSTTCTLRNYFPKCNYALDVEYRESFWQTDADVHEVMLDYYIDHGIVADSEDYGNVSDDRFAAKHDFSQVGTSPFSVKNDKKDN